jgi:predicted transcriptional regulator
MKHRSKIEIICQILEVANGGDVTQTKIMYKALLSYPQMKEYLMFLIEKNLLRYDQDNRTFKTTENGLRFLDKCGGMGDMMNKLREQRLRQF